MKHFKCIVFLTGGLESEADYKYKGYGEKCEFDKSKVKANISGAVNISKDEGGRPSILFNEKGL